MKYLSPLKINLTYTICNEAEVMLCVREFKLAQFPWLLSFMDAMIKAKEANKEFNY